MSITIGLIYNGLVSQTVASSIGLCLFFIGVIMEYFLEIFGSANEFKFTMSCWIVFTWLVYDTRALVESIYRNQNWGKTVGLSLLQYMVTYNTGARLFSLFYCSCKRNSSRRRDDTRRVYSLIVPPRNF